MYLICNVVLIKLTHKYFNLCMKFIFMQILRKIYLSSFNYLWNLNNLNRFLHIFITAHCYKLKLLLKYFLSMITTQKCNFINIWHILGKEEIIIPMKFTFFLKKRLNYIEWKPENTHKVIYCLNWLIIKLGLFRQDYKLKMIIKINLLKTNSVCGISLT